MLRTFNSIAFAFVFVSLSASAQTLSSDREALSRVQSGNENDGHYLSRLLNTSVTSVRGQSHFCAPAEAPGKEIYGKRTDAKVCALLRPISQTSNVNFDSSDSGNLCSPFWRDGVAPWEGNEEIQNESKAFGTKNFLPPSRKEMAKRGFTVMNRSQVEAQIKKIEALRNEATATCCPEGAEGEECARAMHEVEIRVCRDEASDKDPSVPDSCATANGFYTRTDSEDYEAFMQMFRDGAKSKRIERSFFDHARLPFQKVFDSDKVKALNIALSDKVVSGRIVLSPYHFRGSPKASDMTIAHEFMHACSAIQKQLDIKHDTPTAEASFKTALATWGNSTCEVAEGTTESFSGHMSHLTMDQRGFAGCLVKLAEKSIDPKSSVYSPSACPKAKVEEAFADGLAILFATPAIPNGYPNRACGMVPSVVHPHGAEVMRCLVAFVPSYKKFLEETFNCPVSPVQ